jgi:CRISPR-associated protein Cmr5
MPAEYTTQITGIERGRAAFAYDCAKEGASFEKKSEYKSYVKRIPMLIKTNGLGATFAFMFSKGGTYNEIGTHIIKWLRSEGQITVKLDPAVKEFKDLAGFSITLNSSQYRLLTSEVMAFLGWLRRFADGLIEK